MNNENLKKMFAVSETTTEKLWDMWMVSLESMSWTQDQMESMFRKYLEQRKAVREETTKLVEELMAQAKNNQQQMHKMMQEVFSATLEDKNFPGFTYFDDLNKKIERLSTKIEK